MNDFPTNRTMALLTVAILGCGDETGAQGFTLGRAATLELSVGQSIIASGSTISISSGSLLPGEEEARVAIRIFNTGQADLAISEITLVSDPPDTFRLAADSDSYAPLSTGPYTIAPQSAEVGRASLIAHVIVRRPARTAIPTGTIRIRSNSVAAGASQPELVYNLSLETSPPKLVSVPGLVDLGEVPVGENRQATFAVDNRGGDMLVVDRVILAGHEGFAVAFGRHNWTSAQTSSELMINPPIEIRPGQQANAAVQYIASAPENATAQLILYSNDPSATQGSILVLVANAGAPTTPIVAVDAPNGAAGKVTCLLVTEAVDTEPLTYSWHWQIGDNAAFSTFGPSLGADQVRDCDRIRCWAEVTDGHGVVSSNLAEAILPFGSDCDDQNVCTDDTCGAQGGCVTSNNSASCADSDLCNGAERCLAGACQPGTPVSCAGVQNPCIEKICNAATGQCDLSRPNGAPCADDNICNGSETCQSGSCRTASALDCSGVTDPCIEKICNPATGICDLAKPDGASCIDDDLCGGDGTCQGGLCTSGAPIRGSTAGCPALSCDEIKALAPGASDGLYWLSPNSGAALQAYCDMTTDGGGWTRVFGHQITDSRFHAPPAYDIAQGLPAAAVDAGYVSPQALATLMGYFGATELRFVCAKPSLTRKVHIMTSDPAVLAYLTGSSANMPLALGTFSALPDDNSLLAGDPTRWGHVGGYYVGRWGSDGIPPERRLVDHAFFIGFTAHWLLIPSRAECDDHINTTPNFALNGSWRIYVR